MAQPKEIDLELERATARKSLRDAHDIIDRLITGMQAARKRESLRRTEPLAEEILEAADRIEADLIPLEAFRQRTTEVRGRNLFVRDLRILVDAVKGKV